MQAVSVQGILKVACVNARGCCYFSREAMEAWKSARYYKREGAQVGNTYGRMMSARRSGAVCEKRLQGEGGSAKHNEHSKTKKN